MFTNVMFAATGTSDTMAPSAVNFRKARKNDTIKVGARKEGLRWDT